MGTKAYYEDVTNGIIKGMLEKFYSNGDKSQKQYSGMLQVAFLTFRYQQLKSAMMHRNSVLDSSLLSDHILASNIHRNGNMDDETYNVYETLNQEMQANVNGRPWNGLPDLIIYIDISPEKEIEEIMRRGRNMEMSPDLVDYYHSVNDAYSRWYSGFVGAPVIKIDREKYDYVNNLQDRKQVLHDIYRRLFELGKLNQGEFDKLRKELEDMQLTSISKDGMEVDA